MARHPVRAMLVPASAPARSAPAASPPATLARAGTRPYDGPMSSAPPGPGTTRAPTLWLWLTLLPIGFGAWVPVAAGARARRPRWIAYGVVACAMVMTALALPQSDDGGFTDVAGVLLFSGWLATIGWTVVCRGSYAVRAGAAQHREVQDLQIDIKEGERRRARRLAETDPVAALQRGVGRPDVEGADHGWLVDVNHAPAATLTTLPGVDEDIARRIVATREEVGLFSSVDDMAFVLDLPPDRTPVLRGLAVAIRG